jgi:hypothetical protein
VSPAERPDLPSDVPLIRADRFATSPAQGNHRDLL